MCQLLGMNCNVPTDIAFSFRGFRQRAGVTDQHSDGFGIGFFEEAGCRLFLDYQAASESPIARIIDHYPIKSINVIAHIRKATQGVVSLANCHPFQREMWGQYWLFAHNGDLKSLPPELGKGHFYQPVGSTDSEQAFCYLLEKLRSKHEKMPSSEVLFAELKEITSTLAEFGVFNFILSNGKFMFAHCSTNLSYIVRKAPFTTAHLLDEDVTFDFSTVTTPTDRVAVIATLPLTDNETWTKFEPDQLIMFIDGEPVLEQNCPHSRPSKATTNTCSS
ncbi:class II glutamine amidotransferase [Leeia sp. TBRC 13508]|uniref:Class II glutamine amidotransferase n=1 Tax=Leeia speluncae TaxID=2884804 RepID=A0ABS8D798_9NEIS|nr:class II glutamine amidotransferase [Leeia speluncae]MCB6183913.1 class II glutamine amidotransferase [Leeia speluncae]